jgi:hypothetical protein
MSHGARAVLADCAENRGADGGTPLASLATSEWRPTVSVLEESMRRCTCITSWLPNSTLISLSALIAVSALIGVAGESEGRQSAPSSKPHLLRTAWGDPDISGTYYRPHGLAPVYCGPDAKNVIVIPPLWEGVTQITQSPQSVALRSQFARNSRTVLLDGRHGEEPRSQSQFGESRARWEERTLVITSWNLHRKVLIALTGRDADGSHEVQVVERFTPARNGLLHYEFAVEDPAVYSEGMTIAFTLAPTGWRGALLYGVPPCAMEP